MASADKVGKLFEKLELLPPLPSNWKLLRQLVPPTILEYPDFWWGSHEATLKFSLDDTELESLSFRQEWDIAAQFFQLSTPEGPLEKFNGNIKLHINRESLSHDLNMKCFPERARLLKKLVLQHFRKNPVTISVNCELAYEVGIPDTVASIVVVLTLIERNKIMNSVPAPTTGQGEANPQLQNYQNISAARFRTEIMNRTHIPKQETMNAIKDMMRQEYQNTGIMDKRISVNCPLKRSRLVLPVKYRSCKHLECFELDHFLHLIETTQEFSIVKCPICKAAVKSKDLRLDDFFANLVNASDLNGNRDSTAEFVRMYASGEFEWVPFSSPALVPNNTANTKGNGARPVAELLEAIDCRPNISMPCSLSRVVEMIKSSSWGLPSVKLSTVCCMSGKRIFRPARFITCLHPQCFDLETFLKLREKDSVGRPKCPVCGTQGQLADLRIDELFSLILHTSDSKGIKDPKATSVQIFANGKWELVTEKNIPTTAPARQTAPAPASSRIDRMPSTRPSVSSTVSSSGSVSTPPRTSTAPRPRITSPSLLSNTAPRITTPPTRNNAPAIRTALAPIMAPAPTAPITTSSSTGQQTKTTKMLPPPCKSNNPHERRLNEILRRPKIEINQSLLMVRKIIKQDYDMTRLDYLEIRVNCQLTTARLINPVRYRACRCTLPQCFELEAFLKLVENSDRFKFQKCPICDGDVKLKDLAVDELVYNILHNPDKSGVLDETLASVRIYENGSWQWEAKKRKSNDEAMSIIDIDDDSDTDLDVLDSKASVLTKTSAGAACETPAPASAPVKPSPANPEPELITIEDSPANVNRAPQLGRNPRQANQNRNNNSSRTDGSTNNEPGRQFRGQNRQNNVGRGRAGNSGNAVMEYRSRRKRKRQKPTNTRFDSRAPLPQQHQAPRNGYQGGHPGQYPHSNSFSGNPHATPNPWTQIPHTNYGGPGPTTVVGQMNVNIGVGHNWAPPSPQWNGPPPPGWQNLNAGLQYNIRNSNWYYGQGHRHH